MRKPPSILMLLIYVCVSTLYLHSANLSKDSTVEKTRYLRSDATKSTLNFQPLFSTTNVETETHSTLFSPSLYFSFFVLCFLLILSLGIWYLFHTKNILMYQSQLRLVEEREKERQKIAKALHDEVAGNLESLQRRLRQMKLDQESKELTKLKENVRTLSHELTSVSFDELAFKEQVINLIADFTEENVKVQLSGIQNIHWEKVNNALKRIIFICLRESLMNIGKHAKADNITITFSNNKKGICFAIEDDGVGIKTRGVCKGIGLKNMIERVAEINGQLDVQSTPKKGTKLTFEIPFV